MAKGERVYVGPPVLFRGRWVYRGTPLRELPRRKGERHDEVEEAFAEALKAYGLKLKEVVKDGN